MNLSLSTISILLAFSIFLIVIGCNAKLKIKNLRFNREDDIYIWDNWTDTLYSLLFGEKEPMQICKAFGLEYDKYMMACNIIGKKPDFRKEATKRVLGVFSFIVGVILTIIFRNPIPIIAGIILYYFLAAYVVKSAENKARDRKNQLSNDIVRFTDLLLSALQINLPIDTALITTANSIPCVLSEEIKISIAETQMGAKNWQKALEDIARKYEIDILSDFVMDIITSYNKGVSILDAVVRKNTEIKQTQILIAKEKTAKMSTAILAPVTFFKIIPLIIIMLLPIFLQIMGIF